MQKEKLHISSASLSKLFYRAGVRVMTDDCQDAINEIVRNKIDRIIRVASEINTDRGKKMIIPEDLYFSLNTLGINVVRISEPSGKIFSTKNTSC